MTLQDRNSSLGMYVVVVGYKVFVRHALFLLDQNGSFYYLSKATRVRVTCLEGFGHHDGQVRQGEDQID